MERISSSSTPIVPENGCTGIAMRYSPQPGENYLLTALELKSGPHNRRRDLFPGNSGVITAAGWDTQTNLLTITLDSAGKPASATFQLSTLREITAIYSPLSGDRNLTLEVVL